MRRAVIANKAMMAMVLVLPIPFSACAQDIVDELDSDLIDAARNGQTERVRALLHAGLESDTKDEIGSTALLEAALNGRTETVEALLDAGVDVNAKDNDGATALMYSLLIRGDAELVKLLLDAGADVNEKSNDGWMALMLAEEDGHSDVVDLLKQAGANE